MNLSCSLSLIRYYGLFLERMLLQWRVAGNNYKISKLCINTNDLSLTNPTLIRLEDTAGLTFDLKLQPDTDLSNICILMEKTSCPSVTTSSTKSCFHCIGSSSLDGIKKLWAHWATLDEEKEEILQSYNNSLPNLCSVTTRSLAHGPESTRHLLWTRRIWQ